MTTRLARTALACLSLLAPIAVRAQQSPSTAPASAAAVVPADASVAAPAPATEAKPAAEKSYRELGGHTFLPSHLLSDPFSYTAVGLFWGAGTGSATGPTVKWDPTTQRPVWDPTVTRSYDYVGLALGLVLNVRILEYLSVYALVDSGAYLGDSGSSMLVVGTNARLGGSLGVKGSLPIGDKVRLSAAMGVEYGPVFTALIANGLIDAFQSGAINADQFLQSNTALTWTPAVSAAYAPWAFLGLTGTARFYFPTGSGNVQYASNGVSLAAMADFDFLKVLPWLPVGVNGTYALLTPLGGTLATSQEFGFGLWYTGRRELAAGIEIDWRNGKIENGQTSNQMLAWLNLRYYWGN